jgi:hypothetical protein
MVKVCENSQNFVGIGWKLLKTGWIWMKTNINNSWKTDSIWFFFKWWKIDQTGQKESKIVENLSKMVNCWKIVKNKSDCGRK